MHVQAVQRGAKRVANRELGARQRLRREKKAIDASRAKSDISTPVEKKASNVTTHALRLPGDGGDGAHGRDAGGREGGHGREYY